MRFVFEVALVTCAIGLGWRGATATWEHVIGPNRFGTIGTLTVLDGALCNAFSSVGCRRTTPGRGSTERVREGNTYCHAHWRGAPGYLRERMTITCGFSSILYFRDLKFNRLWPGVR